MKRAIHIATMLLLLLLPRAINCFGQIVYESGNISTFAFMVIPAGTAMSEVIVGNEFEVLKKGREIILLKKGDPYLTKMEQDTTVKDLAQKEGISVEDILKENFKVLVPDPRKIGFSNLFVKSEDGEDLAIPYIEAEWNPSVKGIVAYWGGGKEKWFKARLKKPLIGVDTKSALQNTDSPNLVRNVVLVNGTSTAAAIASISVTVYGTSSNSGKLRRIGYVLNLQTSTLEPTLGLPGTEYEFKAESDPKRSQYIQIDGKAMASNLVFRSEPVYPELAKRARVQGKVQMEVFISKDGAVQIAKVIQGHPLLDQAAVAAVSQWRYKPTLVNGQPVEVQTNVELEFTLQK
jgi:TonB family protein